MKSFVVLLDRFLGPLYRLFAYIAAFFLVAIGVLVLTSIISRQVHINIPGINEYAGFCMAAATFFALAYTFPNGQHIRVELFLGMVSPRISHWLNVFCYGFASALTVYGGYQFFKLAHVSFKLNEKSQGIDATPLWIPQSALVLGFGLFAIACMHQFLRLLTAPADTPDVHPEVEGTEPFEARLGE